MSYIISAEITDNKLVVTGEDLIDPQHILKKVLETRRPCVMKFLDIVGGRFQEPIDFDVYEGGVDEWWGIGSVFCMELGLVVTLKIKNTDFELTVE